MFFFVFSRFQFIICAHNWNWSSYTCIWYRIVRNDSQPYHEWLHNYVFPHPSEYDSFYLNCSGYEFVMHLWKSVFIKVTQNFICIQLIALIYSFFLFVCLPASEPACLNFRCVVVPTINVNILSQLRNSNSNVDK